MTQSEAAELSGILVPQFDLMNDTEGYGYPKGSRVYKINMQQALLLAIMNARFYQFNLETGLPGGVARDAAAIYLRSPVLCGLEPGHRSSDAGSFGRSFGRFPVDAGREYRELRSTTQRGFRPTGRSRR